jgi:hypothetical protein
VTRDRHYIEVEAAIKRRGKRLAQAQVRSDLSGRRFGRLTAIRCVGVDRHRQAWWAVMCLCGNSDIAKGSELRRGHNTKLPCCRRKP